MAKKRERPSAAHARPKRPSTTPAPKRRTAAAGAAALATAPRGGSGGGIADGRSGPPDTGARARTRALLLDAAVRVFARKGAGAAAIHEIAAEAGVANGTFYNYFRTREQLVDAASVRLARRFHESVARSREGALDPAERVAIGSRRFVSLAANDQTWAAALLRVWAASPVLHVQTANAVLTDLRAGRRKGRLRFASEAAAVDLVQGAVLAGMRSVLEGRRAEEHASAVAALILRGLGVDAAEADAIARRALPPLDG